MKLKNIARTVLLAALALCHSAIAADAPKFELDPSWPKVPEKWMLGDASSIAIDAQDNVWVLHCPRTLQGDQAKMAAPAIMIFDSAGNYLRS